jgi:hypothetical protein
LHAIKIPFQVEFTQSVFWKGTLAFLPESVLHDHLINDLATENAPPSEKLFANTVEFFENHCSATSVTLHNRPPFLEFAKVKAIFVPKLKFAYEINKLAIFREWRMERRWFLEGGFV